MNQMLKFSTKKDLLLIIDFEATCSNDNTISYEKMEIIEFAGIIVTKNNFQIQKEFTQFVRPVLNPQLSDYCIGLTTITQEDIEKAKIFPSVLSDFVTEMNPDETTFASWGGYDKNQLIQDCELHKVSYPFDSEHINIKKLVGEYLRLGKKKRSIKKVLEYLKMDFLGIPHRGIDDVRNIIRILQEINKND